MLANAGTMTKSTHCGHAAALGLESALLAARGFTANIAVFEAAQGYVPALYDTGFNVEEMLGFGRAPFCGRLPRAGRADGDPAGVRPVRLLFRYLPRQFRQTSGDLGEQRA